VTISRLRKGSVLRVTREITVRGAFIGRKYKIPASARGVVSDIWTAKQFMGPHGYTGTYYTVIFAWITRDKKGRQKRNRHTHAFEGLSDIPASVKLSKY